MGEGDFVASDHSTDSTLGSRFKDRGNQPALPVLVRKVADLLKRLAR